MSRKKKKKEEEKKKTKKWEKILQCLPFRFNKKEKKKHWKPPHASPILYLTFDHIRLCSSFVLLSFFFLLSFSWNKKREKGNEGHTRTYTTTPQKKKVTRKKKEKQSRKKYIIRKINMTYFFKKEKKKGIETCEHKKGVLIGGRK